MSAAIRAALVVAAAEFRAALAGRLVQGFGVVFALMALAIAGAGLAASGQVVVQGFTRTAVSLLSLALYLLPLVGLVLGAHAFGVEDGGTELLLAQPIARGTVREGLEAAAREYQADEVMVVTITYEHAARRRSYELIAEAFGLPSAWAASA